MLQGGDPPPSHPLLRYGYEIQISLKGDEDFGVLELHCIEQIDLLPIFVSFNCDTFFGKVRICQILYIDLYAGDYAWLL